MIICSSKASLVRITNDSEFSFHRNLPEQIIDFREIFLLRLYDASFLSDSLLKQIRYSEIVEQILQRTKLKNT